MHPQIQIYELGKSVDALWFQLKLVVSSIGELNARWKRGPNRIEPILWWWWLCHVRIRFGWCTVPG